MQTRPPRSVLSLALGIAIVAVSTASILIRLAQQDAPSITIAAFRLALATLVLAPLAIVRHRAELRALHRRELILAVSSGIFLAVHFGAWISSLEYTKVASSVVLVSTGPLWVALLSPLFLHEALARGTVLGLASAIVGGIIIAAGDTCVWDSGLRCDVLTRTSGAGLWGNFLALVGAWAVSGYLLIGRRLRATLSLVPYIFVVYGVSALCLLGTGLITRSLVLALPPQAYMWIILLALIPQLIGHSTYNWALAYLPAALVAVTTLGEPVGSAILAYLILHESPGSFVLAGAVLIMTGIYLSARGAQAAKGALT